MKKKMTIDDLARMIERKVAKKDDLKLFATKDDLKNFATKDDLKRFATKDDLKNFATKDDLQHATVEVLQAVDKIVTKFDKAEKDHAADKLLHDRHEKLLEKLEAKVFIKIGERERQQQVMRKLTR